MDHIIDGDEISSRANILSERDHKNYCELRTVRKNTYFCLSNTLNLATTEEPKKFNIKISFLTNYIIY
jgi:hypothetical protein